MAFTIASPDLNRIATVIAGDGGEVYRATSGRLIAGVRASDVGNGFVRIADPVTNLTVEDIIVERVYKEYGEGAPRGRGPSQGLIGERGNEYLNKEFPKLDYIKTARVVGADGAKKEGAEEEGAGDAL